MGEIGEPERPLQVPEPAREPGRREESPAVPTPEPVRPERVPQPA